MAALLLLLVAIALATAVHLAGMVAAALLLRVPVKTVSFGVGPTLGTLGPGRASLLVKLVPLAGSVNFAAPEDDLRGARAFDDRGRLQKIAIAVSGCAACVIVACVVLGPQAALREAAASWGEFFRVVTAFPGATAQWTPILEALRGNGLVVVFALVCAKVGGLNLLPLAPLNGADALMLLLGKRYDNSAFASGYLKMSVLLLMVVVVLWLIGAAVLIVKGV